MICVRDKAMYVIAEDTFVEVKVTCVGNRVMFSRVGGLCAKGGACEV